jgi:hypothetical protein
MWLRLRAIVSDGTGYADTARVDLFPDVDITPSTVRVSPETLGVATPAEFQFWIHNHGRMPAKRTRWVLMAGDSVLGQGDAEVGPRDSASIALLLPPRLPEGEYPLRVVVDSLHQMNETNETNNVRVASLHVKTWQGYSVDVEDAFGPLSLSTAFPNPSRGRVLLALTLPVAATVEWSVHDVQGRVIWAGPPATRESGRWSLEWSGRHDHGARVAPGIYFAKVRVGHQVWSRRIVMLH